MISLVQILKEASFPKSSDDIMDYIDNVLIETNGFNDIIKSLNSAKKKWSSSDYDKALDYGACEAWNTIIAQVLKTYGYSANSYVGTPKNDELPEHYITIVNNYIFDFVGEQFWGYGLGDKLKDNKVVFSKSDYKDIYDSYKWSKI